MVSGTPRWIRTSRYRSQLEGEPSSRRGVGIVGMVSGVAWVAD